MDRATGNKGTVLGKRRKASAVRTPAVQRRCRPNLREALKLAVKDEERFKMIMEANKQAVSA
jgi:hypothetical protein